MSRSTRMLLFACTHLAAAGAGFAAGIYLLPILIAPAGPDPEVLRSMAATAQFTGEFQRELADSDAFHWGEGTVFVTPDSIALEGRLAPGPDYRLYLSPEFVETEAEFELLKSSMVQVGPVRTFENFVVAVPESVDPASFSAVIIWCESFSQFITAASYR